MLYRRLALSRPPVVLAPFVRLRDHLRVAQAGCLAFLLIPPATGANDAKPAKNNHRCT